MTTLETRQVSPVAAGSPTLRTAGVAVAALACVVVAATLVSALLAPDAPPPPPARNPFGVGIREGGGSATGLAGWILAVQSDFYRRLTALVRAVASEAGSVWPLVTAGFLYGVFHAAGPGHGKAVIAAWILANERDLPRGLAAAAAAAVLQAVVAVVLVATLALALGATARAMTAATGLVESASFGAVAALGAWLLWRKSESLVVRLWPQFARAHGHAPGEACGDGCSHAPLPGPAEAARGWRSMLGVVVAAGLRPCSGAIIVLVFALSQSVFAAGVAATFAMALGTALVTGALAALAVFAKGGALRLAASGGPRLALAGTALEVLAAAAVLALGLALLAGVWRGIGL